MKSNLQKSISSLILIFLLGSQAVVAGPLEDLQPGHWAAISLNTIKDVDPCPARNCSYSASGGVASVTDVWTGGAFATKFGVKGGLIAWGGGHLGYDGNEIYVFSLDTLMWERYTEPVINPVCSPTFGEYQDGSPCSAHTYDYVNYHPNTDSFVLLTSSANVDIGGSYSPTVHLYNFTTNTWRRGANRPNATSSMSGSSSAYDPSRDVFWLLPSYSQKFSQYNPNANNGAGQWTVYSSYAIDIDSVSAIDPIRDLFVTIDGRSRKTVRVMDLSVPTAKAITISTSGDTAIQNSSANGFEWDPDNSLFVAWNTGADIYTLKPPPANQDWRTTSWVWTRVSPAATNNVTPTARNRNGTYSRFQYVPYLKGFIVINRVTDAVYAYKMPTTSISISLSVSANTINSGDSVTLTWAAPSASSCSAQGDWSGTKAATGSELINSITADSTFTLSCTGAAGTSSRTVRVSLIQLSPPSLSLSVSPTSVSSGESATLNWSSSNADSCTAQGSWSGTKSVTVTGNESVGPLLINSTFTLTCSNAQGSVSRSVNVSVTAVGVTPDPVAPTVSINVTPTQLNVGDFAKLSWSSTDVDTCLASGDWSGWSGDQLSVGTDVEVGPIEFDSEFVLTCKGVGGFDTSTVSVSVLSDQITDLSTDEENAGAINLYGLLMLLLGAVYRNSKTKS